MSDVKTDIRHWATAPNAMLDGALVCDPSMPARFVCVDGTSYSADKMVDAGTPPVLQIVWRVNYLMLGTQAASNDVLPRSNMGGLVEDTGGGKKNHEDMDERCW